MRRPSGVFDVNYIQDMKIFRTKNHVLGIIILIGLFLSIPVFKSSYWLTFINTTAITIIALQGLNILSGYCGQISLGHSAFMAVGAYSATIMATHLGLPFWFCMFLGAICSGIIGLLFGLPSLRIKGYYLAITTIAAQFIIIYLIKNPFPELTGGAIALHVPQFSIGKYYINEEWQFYYLIILLLIMSTFFSKSILRARYGRAFTAIKDNDIAAEAMGINIFKYKLLAFFLGCFFAGFAGAIWAAYAKVISPDDFTLLNSIWQMGMLIVGGLGSTLGPFYGALFIKLLNEICLVAGPFISSIIPYAAAQVSASLVEMSFGITIILFLVYEPRGIAHRWEILKEYYRLWPFTY